VRYRVTEVRDERGEPLSDGLTYRVATVDYLVRGGDEQKTLFDTVPASRVHPHLDRLTRDLLAEHLRDASPIDPDRAPAPTPRTRFTSVLR
jgi:hypothetical protein